MVIHVLIVDSHATLWDDLSAEFERVGYRATGARTLADALAVARDDPVDLVILDVMLPDFDRLQVLRSEFKAPVLFLTEPYDLYRVRREAQTTDDFVVKPFQPAVLLVRMRALVRRAEASSKVPARPPKLSVGDLVIDPEIHVVVVGNRHVEMTPREFNVLYALAERPGHVLSVDNLIERVWGTDYAGEPQIVYVNIRSLREKLEEDPACPQRIITVRGVGYKLEPALQ